MLTTAIPDINTSKMNANVEQLPKQHKSAEQQMLERASADYASKLRFILGRGAKVVIQIEGIGLVKVSTIAEFLTDEEGNSVQLQKSDSLLSEGEVFIHHNIQGEGYCIERIAQ